MIRFDWDGLAPGQAVHVHHPMATVAPARPGTVAAVEVRGAGRGNVVAVRLDDGEREVIHPSWQAAHVVAAAPSACWRCAALVEAGCAAG